MPDDLHAAWSITQNLFSFVSYTSFNKQIQSYESSFEEKLRYRIRKL